METIRLVITLAANNGWSIYLDMKSASLHDELRENVFVEQHLVISRKGEHEVYKLKKHSIDSHKHHKFGIVIYMVISLNKAFEI